MRKFHWNLENFPINTTKLPKNDDMKKLKHRGLKISSNFNTLLLISFDTLFAQFHFFIIDKPQEI